MARSFFAIRPAFLLTGILLAAVCLLLAGCSGNTIKFNYPDEKVDFKVENLTTPSVYLDLVTDMRPVEQRTGGGHFLGIDFPSDKAWEKDVTQIYAEALAKDVEQTNLVQIVPLLGQADYVLSADILSLGCRFDRTLGSFVLPFSIGGAAGFALGSDPSNRAKMAVALGLVSMVAIPMPSKNKAEVEIRLSLKDNQGDILWQESCLGEIEEKVYAAATSRQDQRYVDEHLTLALKRANGCLLMQLRQFLLEGK